MKETRLALPQESMLRDALLRLLEEEGLAPQEDWVSVRRVNAPWARAEVYTVVIAYEPARADLSLALRRTMGNPAKGALEVWVLSDADARLLCAAGEPKIESKRSSPSI